MRRGLHVQGGRPLWHTLLGDPGADPQVLPHIRRHGRDGSAHVPARPAGDGPGVGGGAQRHGGGRAADGGLHQAHHEGQGADENLGTQARRTHADGQAPGKAQDQEGQEGCVLCAGEGDNGLRVSAHAAVRGRVEQQLGRYGNHQAELAGHPHALQDELDQVGPEGKIAALAVEAESHRPPRTSRGRRARRSGRDAGGAGGAGHRAHGLQSVHREVHRGPAGG
mmetsp:Transcript_21532/g.54299  ORF Transcript_21532/g.54299 Transcript_21532/m.54299 type:complete len:223 (+) Transcript_21532:1429-2097(+)